MTDARRCRCHPPYLSLADVHKPPERIVILVSDALVLFPHQLFEDNASLGRDKQVFLVEDALYFRQYAFHKQKLVLHRASMRVHGRYLEARGIRVTYLDAAAAPDMASAVGRVLAAGPASVHYIDPVDDWLEARLLRALSKAGARPRRHDTPMFLSAPAFLEAQLGGKRSFLMAPFYAAQRRELGVLMEGGRPTGGRWSFDHANRKRLPRQIEIPPVAKPARSAEVREAQAYVEREFPANPGTAADFAYPVTYAEARAWLRDFVQHRLPLFGDYEDAISADEPVLFHSQLTPLLNVGLLTPREVLDAALGRDGVPLNSLEGFVRQLIGWREFMRAAYVFKGRQQRTRNYWRHDRPVPASFWSGTTGVLPVDTVIKRVLRHAYAHHIDRLMILGNFMQLCGFHPDQVYRWFMELFIDAYDWVMVPNVYGMALHADGGLITTKPYVSGSSYILRMSDFPRGEWCANWDALFWGFVERHRAFFEGNPRLGVLVHQLTRMDARKRHDHARRAQLFLAALA